MIEVNNNEFSSFIVYYTLYFINTIDMSFICVYLTNQSIDKHYYSEHKNTNKILLTYTKIYSKNL